MNKSILLVLIISLASLLISGCTTIFYMSGGVKFSEEVVEPMSNLPEPKNKLIAHRTRLRGMNGNEKYENFSDRLQKEKSIIKHEGNLYFRVDDVVWTGIGVLDHLVNLSNPDIDFSKAESIPLSDIICYDHEKKCVALYREKKQVIMFSSEILKYIDVNVFDYSSLLRSYQLAIQDFNGSLIPPYNNLFLEPLLKKRLLLALQEANSLKRLQVIEKINQYANTNLLKEITKQKNRVKLAERLKYFLTKSSKKELKNLLANKELLVGVEQEVIDQLVDKYRSLKVLGYRDQASAKGFYQAYLITNDASDLVSMLSFFISASDLDFFIADKFEIKKHDFVEQRKVDLFRAVDSFDGYIKAFELTKSKNDVKHAYRLAKTLDQKKELEALLVSQIEPSRMFDVKMTGMVMDDHEKAGTNLIVLGSDVRALKNLVINYKIIQKKNSPISLKYGQYRVTVQGILSGQVRMTMNVFITKVTEVKEVKDIELDTVLLSPNTNWKAGGQLHYSEVIQSVQSHILGVKLVDINVSDFRLSSLKVISIDALP